MHTTAHHKKASCTLFMIATSSLLPKRSIHVKDTPATAVDFHLEIVKQIDELLKDTKPLTTTAPPQTLDQAAACPSAVEDRSPLARHPGREDIIFALRAPLQRPHPIPDEFKADFPEGTSPSFRFVTSLDPLDSLGFKPRDSRVEIIDLASLRGKTLDTTTHFPRPQTPAPRHPHEDIAFLSAMTDADDQGMEQSQLYYLQSKTFKEDKKTDEDRDLSYIPIDLSERVQQIKDHEDQERHQSHTDTDHKKHHKKEQSQSHTQTTTETKTKKKAKTTKTEPTSEHHTTRLTKKQQKLAARQDKLEERKRQHIAKLQAKQQQQQEKLKLKEQRTHDHASKHKTKHPTPATEKHGLSLFTKKTPAIPSLETDEDLIKFLQITDTLLGQLPDDIIDQFAHSDDFQLYEKIMAKYHVK